MVVMLKKRAVIFSVNLDSVPLLILVNKSNVFNKNLKNIYITKIQLFYNPEYIHSDVIAHSFYPASHVCVEPLPAHFLYVRYTILVMSNVVR